MCYVYVLKSIDHNWYYVGSTQDVTKRVLQHNTKQVRSTKFRAPYRLVYTEEFNTIDEARSRERMIKKNRSIKEDIIKYIGPIV